eukprot:TRINITY_DN58097_c0_g1_i1.p1 TRINITY_DN58097_c0_g1~~TRINITY_DN58097_c0_g1_i1.p1  ORF type:complete len:263 (+),score=43.66 TRINITY_DN58097_c0_g1_i1:57-845(+)
MVKLEQLPLGCRIVFALSAATFALFVLDRHDFFAYAIRCKVSDIIYRFKLHSLLLASVTFDSFPALVTALFISWNRFAFLEYQVGTFGFLLWFCRASVIFHGLFCLFMILMSPFHAKLINEEVHGLWPLIIINVVACVREARNGDVSLWPLPYAVPTSRLPFLLIFTSWLVHSYCTVDVVAAYMVACLCPASIFEPSLEHLDFAEAHIAGRVALAFLQRFDSFVCRPPAVSFSSVGTFGGDGGTSKIRCSSGGLNEDGFLEI